MIPMLATLIDKPFDSSDWIFEIKLDGYRAIAELHRSKVKLYSRNLKSFNDRFPFVIKDLEKINAEAVLDGEIVYLDKFGKPQFQALQNTMKNPTSSNAIIYYVFDLISLNGKNLKSIPLIERKKALKSFLRKKLPYVRFLDHIEGEGKAFFKACVKNKMEGVIGKLKQSPYLSGKRTKNWVKIKKGSRQEAIICGFTEPKGSRKDIGALILGVYRNKTLKFIGHVGGGLTAEELKELKRKLTPLIQKKCPFSPVPKTNTKVTWIKPHYICEVSFSQWTDENLLRQPIFMGLREDKTPKQVKKEIPISIHSKR